MLVAKEKGTKAVMRSAVPSKSTSEFIARRAFAFTREIGREMSAHTIKSDSEPSIKALVGDVARARAARGARQTNVEHSLVRSSKSKSVVERGIQTLQGMTQTMRSALEGQVGVCQCDVLLVGRVCWVAREQS